MRVLLWTDGDRARSAAAREWFYDMHDLLRRHGVDADLNAFGQGHYDIALIHWRRLDHVLKVQDHSPQAHIGVLNPGMLGSLREESINNAPGIGSFTDVAANVDFFVVSSFMWRELLLPLGRRVYQTIDYVTDLRGRPVKTHTATGALVVGYHGNPVHYADDFFPHGARALERLAAEYPITLKVVTNNASAQPGIPGVNTVRVEWALETIGDELQSFDIGICPVFSDLTRLPDSYVYARNPNRVITLLAYGIPSVTSPVFQSCHDLTHGETTMFATSEHGWYDALRQLITRPELRNHIGHQGRRLVEQAFSEDTAVAKFRSMFEEELTHPTCARGGGRSRSQPPVGVWSKLHRVFSQRKGSAS